MKKGLLLIASLMVGMSVWGQTTIFFEKMGTVTANTTLAAHETANGFDNDSYTMSQGGATNPGDLRRTSNIGTDGTNDANVYLTATNAEYGFAIEGINASSFSNLKISFKYRKESATLLPTLALAYWDGFAYQSVSFSFSEAANATSAWYTVSNISLPAGAIRSDLRLRWVKSGTVAVRLDEITLVGTPNDAPTASAVSFSGTLTQGETLTGAYTYGDTESDPEGTSTFKWYRSNDGAGAGKAAIGGATSSTYVLQAGDVTKYISFEVTPVASAGTLTGTAVESSLQGAVAAAANASPVASSVTFSGTLTEGQLLTGSYSYSDTEGNPEGTSTFKWYRSNDGSGSGKTAIGSATSSTYTLQSADISKYISFEVTPVATAGTLTGSPVESALQGAIAALPNDAPVASSVTFTGTLTEGQVLTGSYSYSDTESNPEGTSTFKWYRSDDGSGTNKAAIGSATASTYTLVLADVGKYISFEVTPVASAGTLTGTAVESSLQGAVAVAPVIASVVVNKYTNGTPDKIELLVIDNNLDMVGMIVKDFSTSMGGDGGGKFTFNNVALWQSVPSGTLIILSNDATEADIDPAGDYKIEVGLTNGTYFTNGGGTFDIATTEMVMIKASGSGVSGVTGSIHVLAGGTAGANYTAAPSPKLRATGTSGTGQFVYANNSNSVLNDYNGTDATGAATGLTFGQGNNSTNTTYITALRPANSAPTASSVSFSGTLNVGQLLTGSYTYSDTESDVEGTSTFKWYRSDDGSGTNKAAIGGATSSTYTLVSGDNGKYISFEVTPVATTGITTGTPVESSLQGSVSTPTTVQFSSATSSVAESGGTIDLTVSIANPSGSVATTVEVALTSGTGSAADINTYTTQTVTFPAGSSTSQTVTLTVTDDAVMEGNETLGFILQNVTGGSSATLGAQTTHTLTVTDNDNASITLSGSATESSEDASVITVNLTNDTFEPSLTTGNWTVTNLPAGVSKGTLTRVSNTQATIALSGNRTTDYDTNFSPIVTIDHAELVVTASGSASANSGFTFTATDDAESITVAGDGSITEGSESGEILTVTLAGGTISSTFSQAAWTLNNLPAGLSKGTVTQLNANQVEIAISGTATNYSTDANVTVTVSQDQIDDYSGPDLTSTNNVTFTAVVEAVGFEEQFNYTSHVTNGLSTQSSNVWKKLNTGDSVLVTSGNLAYPGFKQSAGNKISFVGAGTDYYRPISSQSSGTVYFSFILNVTSLGSLNATGGYFGMLSDNATNFGSTIWLKANAPNYKIGIAPRTTTATFSSTDFAINTNVLIVASYQIVSGPANDIVKLWINPSSSTFGAGSEPTPDFNITNSGTDLASIARFLIRQDATAATPNIDMDELRVGSTWASVTPAGTAQNPTTGTYTDVDITGNTNLTGNLTVSGTLTISGANLNTGSNSINLGATGSLSGETTTNYIIGTVIANPTLNGSSPVGIAGLGLTINPNGNVMGSTVVTRRTGSAASVLGVGLNRRWTITPNSQPSSAVNVTITWPSSDDNGLNLGNLFIYKSEDNGATWQMHAGPLSTGTDPRSLSFTTTSFSDWTVGDGDSPLPIELLSWTATPGNKKVTLNWETASELNHDGFEIYRSTTTKENFRLFKSYISSNELKPKGNTGGKYSIVDQSVLNMETYHYKLVDVSVDGKRKEHKILTVIPTDGKPVQPGFVVPITFKISSIYPNPFNPTTNLVFDLPSDGLVVIRLYNVIGQEVQVIRNEIMKKGREKVVNITTNGLPSGVYMVSVEFGGQRLTKSLTFLK